MSTVATELEGLGTGAIESGAAGLEMTVLFELLGQEDIWICNTGASSNVTRSKKGAQNIRQHGSASMGHTGKAMEAALTIDIPGQFVSCDGTKGARAVLSN